MTRWLAAPRHWLALVRILILLARHDALFLLEAAPGGPAFLALMRFLAPPRADVKGLRQGERLALALPRLGPSFIKLGQALSTRPDLLGDEVARDLATLRDRLPPFPTEAAIRSIETELGLPLDRIFSRFDTTPVAAASVAQVHFAVTTDGAPVAVKLLRPGIEAAFERDLGLLDFIANLLIGLQPGLRRLKPVEVVDRLRETVRFEMDLRLEAAAASELRDNFAGDPDFRVPSIDWTRTARRVLTIERVYGLRVDDRAALIAAGIEPREIVRKAASTFFNMVFRDGFFHADLHPGNLFVAEDGVLVAIDFGIMGRIDWRHRCWLADILHAFLTGNFRRVAELHFDIGFVPATEDVALFAQACRAIGEPLLERPLEEISVGRLLAQLFETTRQFNMVTQPQLLMLQKTMMLTEGVGRALDPSTNMWALARPLIEDWMRVNRSPPARLVAAVQDGIRLMERLPRLIEDLEAVAKWARTAPDRRQAGRTRLAVAVGLALALALAALVVALRHPH